MNPDALGTEELEVIDGELEPGKVLAGKYVIEALLGQGGMGAVWSAYHQQTNRPVAIKALRDVAGRGASDQARARLLREAKAAGSIRHPNVVDVYDVLDSKEGPLLVMELLEGESLQALMSRGTLPPEDVFRILIPAMRGVAAAHQRGVIHRDLKPDNIFLMRNDRGALTGVKVLDFGISKVAAEPLDEGTLTHSGTIIGTPAYMAPEQLTASEIDPRTDVYALGAIAYEALTGVLPHRGETFALMASAKLGADPVPLKKHDRTIPRAIAKAVEKALRRDKKERHQSVAELARDFEPFTDVGFGVDAVQLVSETGRTPVLATASSRKTWFAIAIVGVLVALTTVLSSMWAFGGDEEVAPPFSGEEAAATETIAEEEEAAGAGAGTGTGTAAGTGTGTGTETGAGTGTGTETAAGTGTGTGTETAAGTGTETAAGTGTVAGTGTETGAGAGTGTGTGAGTGTGTETGAGTGTGTGAGAGAGAGASRGGRHRRRRGRMRVVSGRSGTLSASDF